MIARLAPEIQGGRVGPSSGFGVETAAPRAWSLEAATILGSQAREHLGPERGQWRPRTGMFDRDSTGGNRRNTGRRELRSGRTRGRQPRRRSRRSLASDDRPRRQASPLTAPLAAPQNTSSGRRPPDFHRNFDRPEHRQQDHAQDNVRRPAKRGGEPQRQQAAPSNDQQANEHSKYRGPHSLAGRKTPAGEGEICPTTVPASPVADHGHRSEIVVSQVESVAVSALDGAEVWRESVVAGRSTRVGWTLARSEESSPNPNAMTSTRSALDITRRTGGTIRNRCQVLAGLLEPLTLVPYTTSAGHISTNTCNRGPDLSSAETLPTSWGLTYSRGAVRPCRGHATVCQRGDYRFRLRS